MPWLNVFRRQARTGAGTEGIGVRAEEGRIRLFWAGEEISRGPGLSVSVLTPGGWTGDEASPASVRRGRDGLEVRRRTAGVETLWSLRPEGDHALRVRLHLRAQRPATLEGVRVRLWFSRGFTRFLAGSEDGPFPDRFEPGEALCAVPARSVWVCGSAVGMEAAGAEAFEGRVRVGNAGERLPVRLIEWEREDSRVLGADPWESWSGVITFCGARAVRERLEEEFSAGPGDLGLVRRGRLLEWAGRSLVLDRERVRIFDGPQEITRGRGLCADCLVQERWWSDAAAPVRGLERDKSGLRWTRSGPGLPFVSHWRAEPEGAALRVRVRIELAPGRRVDRAAVRMFVDTRFDRWRTDSESGFFPDRFESRDWCPVEFFARRAPRVRLGCGQPGAGLEFAAQGENPGLELFNAEDAARARVAGFAVEPAAGTETLDWSVRLSWNGEETPEEARPREAPGEPGIVFYGADASRHDRVAGAGGAFSAALARLEAQVAAGAPARVTVGLDRRNFWMAGEIVSWLIRRLGVWTDPRVYPFDPRPTRTLAQRYAGYVEDLRHLLRTRVHEAGPHRVSVEITDAGLERLLENASRHVPEYSEREVLRLLGIVCEQAFIGPETVVVDLVHRCNTRCVHCWIHSPLKPPAEGGDLALDEAMYARFLEDAASLWVEGVVFQGDGEPLLHPRFWDLVRATRERGLETAFFTNGVLLDEAAARECVRLRVREVYCSFPAGSAETYARVQPGVAAGVFESTVSKLARFTALRREAGVDRPRLRMTHVIHALNARDIEAMAEIDCLAGADSVRYYLVRLDEGIASLRLSERDVGEIRAQLPRARARLKKAGIGLEENIDFQLERLDPSTGRWTGDEFVRHGCPVGWFFALLLARGELSYCCHMRVVGNLSRQPFAQLWQSPEYAKLRLEGKYLGHGGTPLLDEACACCDTHQVILRIRELARRYGLESYLEGAAQPAPGTNVNASH